MYCLLQQLRGVNMTLNVHILILADIIMCVSLLTVPCVFYYRSAVVIVIISSSYSGFVTVSP